MNIGKRIKERRQALKMSVDELSEIVGKDRATIYRYESGDIENLSIGVLEPIAKALDTTPAYLMGWDKDLSSETKKDNSEIASLIIRLRTDRLFLEAVKKIDELDSKRMQSLLAFLS